MESKPGKITVKCEKEVAYDSPDHIHPEGTRKDNSVNRLFNKKLYRLFGEYKQLRILDLGCSGGGFVKECIDGGHIAIGLEGSDYSKKFKRAEWRTIPENLFTCDITKDFDIYFNNKRMMFNVVTSWELLEHIKEKELIKLAENVKKHLSKDGIWIMSISTVSSKVNGVELHQTIKPKKWWINKFKEMGFIIKEDYRKYFRNQFVRGPFQDKAPGFNLIVTLSQNQTPSLPKESIKLKLWEKMIGGRIYRAIKMLISGEVASGWQRG